jgi:hypothetical protein
MTIPMHAFRRLALYSILILNGLMMTIACGPPPSDAEVDQEVKKIVAAFQQSDVDKIMSFYGKDFYKNRNPEEWRMELQDLFKKYGKTQSVSMRNKQADTRFSAKFYIYQFDTLHDNHKRIKHTLTLIRPVNNSDKIVVVGHMIKTR